MKGYKRGKGIGRFKRGKKVTSLEGLRKGMLLIHDSHQFKATGLAKILNVSHGRKTDITPSTGFYGIYVNPKNTKERIGGKWFTWDFALKYKDDSYYRVKR